MLTTVIIIVSLFLSFFFSGLEIAYVSANKLQMHVESRKVSLAGRLFSRITNSPVRFLATLLLGNTLALVLFGVFSSAVLEDMLRSFHFSSLSVLAIQSMITTFIVLVIADFIPKNLFRVNPNRVLKFFTLPCIIAYYILLPFTLAVLAFVNFLMRKIFKVALVRYKSTFTKTDLFSYIDDHANIDVESLGEVKHEVQIFRNALTFPDVKVRDCMIPRMDIAAVEIGEGFEKLKKMFEKTELSRVAIYKESIDNIIGYVHFHAMFKKVDDIQKIVIAAPLVPESMPAKDALRILMQQHKNLSVVVDEFGMTSGIITTEDILEEIFGEIDDEHDRDELAEKQISENEFIFSARLKIDDINSSYGLGIPVSTDYMTLGGFILNHTGSIPKARELLVIHNFSIKILSSTPTRIEQVYLTREKKENE
ncbi:MAG TPA: hemolysin family protein [Bacteroidia bacterium]|jgi:putative hemolysin|nr:hemolysin family protein [Bacteroidia bacterium]